MIKTAKYLVKHGKVKRIGETVFEVEDHNVRLLTKKGRLLLTCDCKNHTTFCVENPMCHHKWAVITYLNDNNFIEKIDKMIDMYKKWKDLKLDVSIDTMIYDLNNLREVK